MSEPQEVISVTEQIGQQCGAAWDALVASQEDLEYARLTQNPRRYRQALNEVLRREVAYGRALAAWSEVIER